MNPNHRGLASKLSAVAFLVTLLVLISSGFRTADLKNATITATDDTLFSYADGWTISTQEDTWSPVGELPDSVTTSGNSVTLSKTVEPQSEQQILLFRNNRLSITITADGEPIYEINESPLARQLLVSCLCAATLPDSTEPYLLEVTMDQFSGGVCSLPSFSIGTTHAVYADILGDNLYTVISLIVLLALGMVMILAMVFFVIKKVLDRRLLMMLFFLLDMELWAFGDSSLPLLFSNRIEYWALLSYYAFMFLPLPATLFVWETCGQKNRGLWVMTSIFSVNLLVQTAISAVGLLRLDQTLFITHILLVIDLILLFHYSYRAWEKTDYYRNNRMLLVGLVIIFVIVFLGFAIYWTTNRGHYQNIVLGGISLFFADMLCILIASYQEEVQRSKLKIAELAIYQKLSLLDNLSGLGNRRSFENTLKELAETVPPEENALLVMMDVNGLKIVNDSFGHPAGDELIIAAANCIQSIYGQYGTCYRVGGDEFTALLRNPPRSPENLNQEFLAYMEHYNKTANYPLSIAKGECWLYTSSGERRTTHQWRQEADVLMYEDKMRYHGMSKELDQELQEMATRVVSSVESRSSTGVGHAQHVKELSALFCSWLGLSWETSSQVKLAATLHDIGEVNIPKEILEKNGPLTDQEREIVQQHTKMSANMLSSTASIWDIFEIIRHHHERYDGKGYPDGLSREDIPIGARIIALADSIDAMTSRRAYREAMSPEACRQEIEDNLGKMYDPAIGHIVLRHWGEVEALLRSQSNASQDVPQDGAQDADPTPTPSK
jgi:diguanylate cyclase (GGDEF)-like protein